VSQPATGVEGFTPSPVPRPLSARQSASDSAGLEESCARPTAVARWVGREAPVQPWDIDAIACASASACEAVGATSASVAVTLFACRTPSLCPVLDASSKGPSAVAIHTTDGGRRWLSTKLHRLRQDAHAVACPRARMRSDRRVPYGRVSGPSAGPDVEVFRTTDGGSSWRSQTVPSGISDALSGRLSSPLDLRGRRLQARWCSHYPPSLIRDTGREEASP